MKYKQPLTATQQSLVEEHLFLVRWTVREYIRVNESVCGLGFEDICQEGALALCHAAVTYTANSGVQFHTYAVAVIRNHLLDHCRRVAAQRKNLPTLSLDAPPSEDKPPTWTPLPFSDDTDRWLSDLYVAQLLDYGKRTYTGVVKLGVEALELKIKGYSGADIARLYHTKPNHVGAWISKAAARLRTDAMTADLSGRPVENTAAVS